MFLFNRPTFVYRIVHNAHSIAQLYRNNLLLHSHFQFEWQMVIYGIVQLYVDFFYDFEFSVYGWCWCVYGLSGGMFVISLVLNVDMIC